jgi:phosphate transport system protein
MKHQTLLVDKRRDALTQGLAALGERAVGALRRSLVALRTGDATLAREVIEQESAFARERRSLDGQALLALAAYQPAGVDLRTIGASLEMVAELHRIADYATGVARILLRGAERRFPADLLERIASMGDTAVAMLVDTLAAYGRGADEALARAAAARDDAVDALQRESVAAIVALIQADPQQAATGIELTWIAHNFERVADRATNIAELVVYIATGETPELD